MIAKTGSGRQCRCPACPRIVGFSMHIITKGINHMSSFSGNSVHTSHLFQSSKAGRRSKFFVASLACILAIGATMLTHVQPASAAVAPGTTVLLADAIGSPACGGGSPLSTATL